MISQIKLRPPLFNFAYHHHDWLETVARYSQAEPWGRKHHILKRHLFVNFEIAQMQGKVYENIDDGVAFWHPNLVNDIADPVWLKYVRNRRQDVAEWYFTGVVTGDSPAQGIHVDDYRISYDIPEFNYGWKLYFDQRSLDHIFEDTENYYRLQAVFGKELSANKHLMYRMLLGEIAYQQKDMLVIPQFFHGEYHFILPLFLMQPDIMDLAATLTPNHEMQRYEISTLLLPGQTYNSVRPVARNRRSLPNWLQLSEERIQRDSDIILQFYNENINRDEYFDDDDYDDED